MDRWEFQYQSQYSNSWTRDSTGSGPYTDQQINLKFDSMLKRPNVKRVRVLCNGKVIDSR